MIRSLRRILVPLDGSPLAERALPAAASLAKRVGASVELVGVQPLIAEYLVPDDAVMAGGVLEEAAARHLEHYLEQAESQLRMSSGIEVSHHLLHGQPAARIAELARTRRCGLIIMTTHGRGGLARMWLGSVADQLLRIARTPVLLLHPEDTTPRSLAPAVIALDGDLEGLVLDRGIAFARLVSGDRFTLVHVVEPPTPVFTEFSAVPAGFDPDAVNEAVTRARDHLEVIARRMRERGCDVTIDVKVASSIAREICETADRLAAGVVVVGTHGRQGAKRLLLGSVADKVVRSATRPVLVVPMAGARRIARNRAVGARQRMKTVYAV